MRRLVSCLFVSGALALGAASVAGCAANTNLPGVAVNPRAICPGAVVQNTRELQALSGCRTIAGDLRIEHSDLESLTGLEQLEAVSGMLRISGNTKLEDLDGLSNLRWVDRVVIHDNRQLTSLEDLRGFNHARTVVISRNPELDDLQGLEALHTVDVLHISENGLYRTKGLDGLTHVRQLRVIKNQQLLSLRGLDQLKSADGIQILNNPRIAAQLGRLAGLRNVTRELIIRENYGLSERDVELMVQSARGSVQIAAR